MWDKWQDSHLKHPDGLNSNILCLEKSASPKLRPRPVAEWESWQFESFDLLTLDPVFASEVQ